MFLQGKSQLRSTVVDHIQLRSTNIQKCIEKWFKQFYKSKNFLAVMDWKTFQTCFVCNSGILTFFISNRFWNLFWNWVSAFILYGHFIPRYWKENPLFVLTKQIFLSPVFFLFFGKGKNRDLVLIFQRKKCKKFQG